MKKEMIEIEINRIVALIKNFGWELVEKKISGLLVQITFEKDVQQMEENVREVFWIRIREVMKMFQWKIAEEVTEDGLLSLRAEKEADE